MKVVACGPISSGTRWIYYLIKHWGVDVIHWSQPNWQTFWTHDEWPEDTRFVIIIRRPDASTRSAFSRGHGRNLKDRVGFDEWVSTDKKAETSLELMEQWWQQAMELFSHFPPERTLWVSYEALQYDLENQVKGIAGFLGVQDPAISVPAKLGTNEHWLER